MWPAINIPTIVTGRLLSLQNFISLVPILVDIVSQFVQVCNNKKFSIINEYQVPWNIYKYNYWRKKNAQMILASYKRYSSMDQSTAESSKALTLKILLNFQLGKDCNITMYLKVKSIVIFPNWVAYMFEIFPFLTKYKNIPTFLLYSIDIYIHLISTEIAIFLSLSFFSLSSIQLKTLTL